MALVLTRVMASLLFGVGPMDSVTYAAVWAGLAAVGLLATYLPARRASRVDPVVALARRALTSLGIEALTGRLRY